MKLAVKFSNTVAAAAWRYYAGSKQEDPEPPFDKVSDKGCDICQPTSAVPIHVPRREMQFAILVGPEQAVGVRLFTEEKRLQEGPWLALRPHNLGGRRQ